MFLCFIADVKCQRAIDVTLQEEWMLEGYYTLTVIANLEFDPILLNYLQNISIESYISSGNTLLNKTTEYVSAKPLVSCL